MTGEFNGSSSKEHECAQYKLDFDILRCTNVHFGHIKETSTLCV